MGKIAFGFILGAIVTVIGFMAFHRSPVDVGTTRSVSTDISAVTLSDPGTPSSPQVLDTAPSSSGTLGTSPVSRFETEEARLTRQIDEARQLVAEWSIELEALQISNQLAEAPVVYPLSLSSDFDWVLDEPTGKLLHGLIQREDRDAIWAPQMEAELQQFLYSQTEVIGGFGAPTITCRSTRCEVTLINNAADEELGAVAERLRDEFRWHETYDRFAFTPGSFWVGERYEDGVATIFWSLPRKPE